MSNVAELLINQDAAELYLGPATVVQAGVRDVTVRLENGHTVTAELALALPYVPAIDDVVLALGKDARHYVVGVLHGSGETSLNFRGNVKLRAIGGSLDIGADEEVRVKGKAIALESGQLRLMSDTVIQKCTTMYQRVRDLMNVRAKRIDTNVDEGTVTKAKRATILTEETMTINGKRIHLG